MKGDEKKTYGDVWDEYVTNRFPKIRDDVPAGKNLKEWQVLNTQDENLDWPGDEWGSSADTMGILQSVLFDHVSQDSRHIVEIGSGSGRYTRLLLDEYPAATVVAFDVSQTFIKSLRVRCESAVSNGRLETILLKGDPAEICTYARQAELVEQVDAIVSYDAMVHVDLHTLIVYWVSAARILKIGGVLSMSVADCSGDMAFLKLLHNAPGVYGLCGRPGGHFYWLSASMLEPLLERLGFKLSEITHANGRDVFFVATLEDREIHRKWLSRAGAGW